MIPPTPARLLAASMALVAVLGAVAGSVLETGLPMPPTQWAFVALVLVLPALGWLVAHRRPGNLYGWLLLATADCLGLGALGVGILVSAEPGQSTPLAVLAALLASLFAPFYGLSWVFIPLFFPDGRLPSPRWRVAAWIAAVAITAHWLGVLLLPDQVYVISPVGNPLGITGPGELVVAGMGGLGQLTTFVVALVVLGSLLARLRRGSGPERRRLRWMAAGLAATLGGFLLTSFFLVAGSRALWLGLVSMLGALPAAIAVAVFRHNLLDIRVGIRGSRFFLVFDVRPTVDELLSEMAPGLEEAEPGEQLGRLAGAVRTALDARWAAVTLADGTRVVAGAEEGEPGLTVPAGQGHIACGPRDEGRFTADDRRLLRALAVPVGLAIQSAGLAARLVNAQEAERRRIERNIHDGAQQQIVALIAGLEVARATGGGPEMLALLRDQARQTLDDLRELAAGIHPSVLSQGGLAEALEERCSRLPVASTVNVDPGLRVRRFSDEIEGAVYFTVSEAIANALKHAGASALDVRLTLSGGRLQVTVADDGAGFDPGTAVRRGLVALTDRLAALGGGLDVASAEGEGTTVRAWVPVHD
ncbi:ATP-binding protein [Planomonospora sp. ID67723]|uniref:sensor histidine kinase n=1 Tax=Planomonospora sp. ID67723 TaxID=2738134 RepID=UPI0018C44B50|nr:ATP-binding protein [Planomonospora sp. ID67723]MBG0826433.1 ATP-binding protein [Planomonospora sp. ID67723]